MNLIHHRRPWGTKTLLFRLIQPPCATPQHQAVCVGPNKCQTQARTVMHSAVATFHHAQRLRRNFSLSTAAAFNTSSVTLIRFHNENPMLQQPCLSNTSHSADEDSSREVLRCVGNL